MKRTKGWIWLGVVVVLTGLWGACSRTRIHEHDEWQKIYAARGINNACVIIREHNHEAIHYMNKELCLIRYTPASTFKIFNSLTGLETGVAPDEQFVIPWDSIDRGRPEWNKPMSMREAFKLSNIGYYQEISRRVGRDFMQHYLDTVQYGNKAIGKDADMFWVNNTLQISADEQLGFIKRLYFDQLPFSERSQRIVRSMMLQEGDDNYKLYYKTGTGNFNDSTIYWVVGFAEKIEHVKEREKSMNKSDIRIYPYFFAQNFILPKADTAKDYANLRIDALKDVLRTSFGVPIPATIAR